MDKYYHFTNYDCLDNIKKNGLIPKNGVRCKSIGDDTNGIFLSKGMHNSIVMYALMLSFYEKYTGEEGNKVIQENLLEIQKLEDEAKRTFRKDIDIMYLNAVIDRVNLLKKYNSFTDYLGGDGCFLSIENLDIDYLYPSNCCCVTPIPPGNIKVVGLENTFLDFYIDSRESVLSYFMYLYPIEDILKIVPDDKKASIKRLYEYITEGRNPYYYKLIETPISLYDTEDLKEKTLVY